MISRHREIKPAEPAGQPNLKTTKVVGLFLAMALVTTTGCGTSPQQDQLQHVHYDKNNDGYCDEDGQPMRGTSAYGSGYHGGYYGVPHYGGSTSAGTPNSGRAGISSGSHGGIGSGGSGGGG